LVKSLTLALRDARSVETPHRFVRAATATSRIGNVSCFKIAAQHDFRINGRIALRASDVDPFEHVLREPARSGTGGDAASANNQKQRDSMAVRRMR
jgi:hypothetical protein